MSTSEDFLYVGSSWAARNFEHPDVQRPFTNLAMEWNIGHKNLSMVGSRILERVQHIKSISSDLPIIWIYGEPSFNIQHILGIDDIEFIQRADWLELWNICNRCCLEEIASLKNPVLLVGAHSDIVDCDYANITVANKSWQRFIAQSTGILQDDVIEFTIDDDKNFGLNFQFKHKEQIIITEPCWGIDIVHKTIYANPQIKPDSALTDWTYRILKFWKYLENRDMFYDTHPNINSIKSFAAFLLPIVKDFLTTHQ